MVKYLCAFVALILLLNACSSGPEPELELSSDELRLNSTYPQASFEFRNVGEAGSSLTWSVRSDSPRITASPSEGSLPNVGVGSFEVQVDAAGLAEGATRRANLQVDSDGGSETLSVIYTNAPGPAPDEPGPYLCYPDAGDTITPANTVATTSQSAPNDAYVPGQLLVRYKAEAAGTLQTAAARERAAQAVTRDYSLDVLEANPNNPDYADLVALPEGRSVEAALARLNTDPRVAYAEPNYYLYAQATPNDPFLAQQWNLLDFGLPQAWEIETGQSNVTIAVLDSGVDLSHEDLQGRLVQGCDFFGKDNDPNPGSPKDTAAQTHGTHVAGIAAATGDNGVGVAGVAYAGVEVLPIKVFDDAGGEATVNDVAQAIRWAAGLDVDGVEPNPNPAKVINLSLGGGENRDPETGEPVAIAALNDAIRDAKRAGALTIVAAGNDNREGGAKGDGIFAPANAPDAFAVGSVNATYERSSFSVYSASRRTVNLMAPGGRGPSNCDAVVSTLASETRNDNYGCQAGTSMAAPFVAGVAALLWSQHPDWTVEQVKQRLLDATLFEPDFMNESEYGAGVLCADRALGAATLCGN